MPIRVKIIIFGGDNNYVMYNYYSDNHNNYYHEISGHRQNYYIT